jgi:hypothetical protein
MARDGQSTPLATLSSSDQEVGFRMVGEAAPSLGEPT